VGKRSGTRLLPAADARLSEHSGRNRDAQAEWTDISEDLHGHQLLDTRGVLK